MKKHLIVWVSIVVGALLIALGVYYWLTPAGNLGTFVPGYEPGSAHIHITHAIVSIGVGILAWLFAWIGGGQRK